MSSPCENNDPHLSINKTKEKLYLFYYDMMSQIKEKQVEVKPKTFKKTLNTTTIDQLIEYIKQLIPILVNKQVTQVLADNDDKYASIEHDSNKTTIPSTNDSLIEAYNIKLERDIRRLYKLLFQQKNLTDELNQRNTTQEDLKNKEELEEKNTKLKVRIEELEGQLNDYKRNIELDNETIVSLNTMIENMKKNNHDKNHNYKITGRHMLNSASYSHFNYNSNRNNTSQKTLNVISFDKTVMPKNDLMKSPSYYNHYINDFERMMRIKRLNQKKSPSNKSKGEIIEPLASSLNQSLLINHFLEHNEQFSNYKKRRNESLSCNNTISKRDKSAIPSLQKSKGITAMFKMPITHRQKIKHRLFSASQIALDNRAKDLNNRADIKFGNAYH